MSVQSFEVSNITPGPTLMGQSFLSQSPSITAAPVAPRPSMGGPGMG